MTRGSIVSLTADQRVARALYLAGKQTVHALDEHVNLRTDTPERCPNIYYLLKDHNGGKDPTATDPADRWTSPGGTNVNRTCDCIGGASWCGGFDRYQPARFAHLYSGWINTDSMLLDALGPAKCFAALDRPEPGCFVVCASGSRGHKIGHIGTVVSVPAEWDASKLECWLAVGVVDVASRTPARANQLSTARGWFGTGAQWVVSRMTP